MTNANAIGPEVLSAKLSELNAAQLQQVHALLTRQQEVLSVQSQEIGRAIDSLRGKRSAISTTIAKQAADLTFVAKLIKVRQAGIEGSDAITINDSRTAGEVVRVDGEAPGVVLEARIEG